MTPADQSFLLTLANLLRAGILADPVPPYDRPAWRRFASRVHAS